MSTPATSFAAAQQSLSNFYLSVKFRSPTLAVLMSEDIINVALNALGPDREAGQPAADSLRQKARDLPEIHRRVLDNALVDLGYV